MTIEYSEMYDEWQVLNKHTREVLAVASTYKEAVRERRRLYPVTER